VSNSISTRLHQFDGIPNYTQFLVDSNFYYQKIKLIARGTLKEYLQFRYFFTTETIQNYLYQLIEIVKSFHQRKIIIKDFTSDNLVINSENRL